MSDRFLDALKALLGDRYSITRELDGGGMSRVFLATEVGLKREVVVKVLPPELVSAESLRRFEREIATTVALQHPHILPVLTAGGGDDVIYYITPFVSGHSLRRRLSAGPTFAFEQAVSLARELLSAVAFAHARGIVHRDIKPANVLVAEGHAVLADFGIARALASEDDGASASMTHEGASAYSAPEGSSHPTSDLFAVAAVLHEMLTGVPPTPGPSADLIARSIRQRHPATPRRRVERVARGIASGLAPAAERPTSAADLARLLAGSTARRPWRSVAVPAAIALTLAAVLLLRPSPPVSPSVEQPDSVASLLPTPTRPPSPQTATDSAPPAEVVAAARAPIDSAWWLAEHGDAPGALRQARLADSSGHTNARGRLLHAMLATLDESPEQPTEEPRVAISQSLAARESLDQHDAALAEAWQALVSAQYREAAAQFRTLSTTREVRTWALLGLAETIIRDNFVEPSAASPSGYAFRADWNEGLRALAGALRSTPLAGRDLVFTRLMRVRFAEEGRLRPGRGADNVVYMGRPTASGDTVLFIPYPTGPRTFLPPPGPDNRRAFELMRAELSPLVAQWRHESPGRATPWVLTALLLEASGHIRVAGAERMSAIEAMRQARHLARDDEERAARARDYARLLLRGGDYAGVARLARETLDGVSTRALDTQDQLLPIAIATGRARLGTEMLQRVGGLVTRQVTGPDGSPVVLPPELHRERAAFIVAAALGVCNDEVRGAPARLTLLADAQFPRASRPPWLDFALLQEPLEQAQPCTGLAPLARTSGMVRPINRAAAQLLSGDTASVRGQFLGMDRARAQGGAPPATPEAAVAEALLRVAIGDTTGALGTLQRSLEALPVHPARVFFREGSVGSIGRAMLLAAEWSVGRDAAAARRWMTGVDALWRAADAPLRAEVARVQRLVESIDR